MAIRRFSEIICIENGYSIVENPKHLGMSCNKWLGDKPPSHRASRAAIDAALDVLLDILSGKRTHKPRPRKVTQSQPQRVTFL